MSGASCPLLAVPSPPCGTPFLCYEGMEALNRRQSSVTQIDGRCRERRSAAPVALSGASRPRAMTPGPRGRATCANTIVYRVRPRFQACQRTLPRRRHPARNSGVGWLAVAPWYLEPRQSEVPIRDRGGTASPYLVARSSAHPRLASHRNGCSYLHRVEAARTHRPGQHSGGPHPPA